MLSRSSMLRLFLIIGFGISLAACQTTGEGTKNVTCETVKFVWLSRKDTPGTVRQVVRNNGVWLALCGDPGKAPAGLDNLPTKDVVKKKGKTTLIDRWRIWRP